MTAVLGGDEATVLAAIADAGLTPANINTAGQIVAGGTLEQLAQFAASPPAGARLRPLRVAGAFHTEHMAPAVDALAAAAAGTAVKDPAITLLSNRDGAVVTVGDRLGGADRQPGRVPGPLGPVHGDDGQPRGHRVHRAAPRRHADRAWPSGRCRGSSCSRSRRLTSLTPPGPWSRRTSTAKHGAGRTQWA